MIRTEARVVAEQRMATASLPVSGLKHAWVGVELRQVNSSMRVTVAEDDGGGVVVVVVARGVGPVAAQEARRPHASGRARHFTLGTLPPPLTPAQGRTSSLPVGPSSRSLSPNSAAKRRP